MGRPQTPHHHPTAPAAPAVHGLPAARSSHRSWTGPAPRTSTTGWPTSKAPPAARTRSGWTATSTSTTPTGSGWSPLRHRRHARRRHLHPVRQPPRHACARPAPRPTGATPTTSSAPGCKATGGASHPCTNTSPCSSPPPPPPSARSTTASSNPRRRLPQARTAAPAGPRSATRSAAPAPTARPWPAGNGTPPPTAGSGSRCAWTATTTPATSSGTTRPRNCGAAPSNKSTANYAASAAPSAWTCAAATSRSTNSRYAASSTTTP